MLRRYILPVMVPSRRTPPPGPPPPALDLQIMPFEWAPFSFSFSTLILILIEELHGPDQTRPDQTDTDISERRQGSFHAKTRSGAHHTHAQSTRPACCLGNETGLGTKAARPVTRHDWSTGIPYLFYLYVKQLTWSGRNTLLYRWWRIRIYRKQQSSKQEDRKTDPHPYPYPYPYVEYSTLQ